MRRWFICCFAISLILLPALAGCGGKPAPAPKANAAAQKAAPAVAKAVDRTGWPVIIAFGDSLTFGQGVAPEKSYPSQLQEQLDKLGYQYRVVNAGISGDTTAGGLARVDAIIRQKPATVILELGANDGLQGRPVTEMKANLEKIIQALQGANIKVIVAGMQIPPNYGPEYTQTFQEIFKDLAAQYKVPLIPFFLDGVGGKPDLNQRDGIHPTADGYVYVVKNVLSVLKPVLSK